MVVTTLGVSPYLRYIAFTNFKLFPISLYREAMHLQWFTPMQYVSGCGYPHSDGMTFTQFAQIAV